ncbi:hypothetical protein AAVH_42948, partial [Aphelenchoides avenae]
ANARFRRFERPDGGVALKAEANGKFVRVDASQGGRLVADRLEVGDWETFKFEQGGYRGRIVQLIARATFKFVSVDNGEERTLSATRDAADKWETFFMTENVDGTISLRSMANGKYISVQFTRGAELT